MSTVVIGVGNPVLTDDSVGILAVRNIAEARPGASTREVYSGGFRLMEAMAGYEKAVVIDSILTEGGQPGAVYRLRLDDIAEPRHTHCTHDTSLDVAIEFGRIAGLQMPRQARLCFSWGDGHCIG